MADTKSFAKKLKDLKTVISDDAHEQATDNEGRQEIDWLDDETFEGQLAVDVYQTSKDIVIKATIAGIRSDDIDIAINNGMVTIKGFRRQDETVADENYFFRECYWGGFSRSIILPVEIIEDRVKASMKNGVLTIVLPKAGTSKVQTINVEDQDEESNEEA